MPIFLLFILGGVVLAAAASAAKSKSQDSRVGPKKPKKYLAAIFKGKTPPLAQIAVTAVAERTAFGGDWPSPHSYGEVLQVFHWIRSLSTEANAIKSTDQPGHGLASGLLSSDATPGVKTQYGWIQEEFMMMMKGKSAPPIWDTPAPIHAMEIALPSLQRWDFAYPASDKGQALMFMGAIIRAIKPRHGTESMLWVWLHDGIDVRLPQFQALVAWAVMWLISPITNAPLPGQDTSATLVATNAKLLSLHSYFAYNYISNDFGNACRDETYQNVNAMQSDHVEGDDDDLATLNVRIANEIVRSVTSYTAGVVNKSEENPLAIALSVVIAVVNAVVSVVSLGSSLGIGGIAVTSVLGTVSKVGSVIASVSSKLSGLANAASSGDFGLGIRAIGGLLATVGVAGALEKEVASVKKEYEEAVAFKDGIVGFAQAGIDVGLATGIAAANFDHTIGLGFNGLKQTIFEAGIDPAAVGLPWNEGQSPAPPIHPIPNQQSSTSMAGGYVGKPIVKK